MKRRALIATLVILVIAGLATAWWITASKDSSTTVGSKQAAKIASKGQKERAGSADLDPGLRPQPGTYQYTGSGKESLSLFGGSKHTFPQEIYGVVKLDPNDSCAWTMDLIFIKEHTEEHNYCTTTTGVQDTGFSRTTEFARYQQTSRYTCDDWALRLRTGARPKSSWSWTCTEKRGGVVKYTATNVGSEKLSVDGSAQDVTHIRISAIQDGRSQGSETSDWWFMDSGLPVKVESRRALTTSAGPLGTMDSAEQFTYALASLDPKPQ